MDVESLLEMKNQMIERSNWKEVTRINKMLGMRKNR